MKIGQSLQSILLRRKSCIFLDSKGNNKPSRKHILALQTEIAKYGYTLSKEVIDNISKKDLKELHNLLLTNLPDMIGSKADNRPLFQNFPKHTPNNTEDFYLKRILGYIEQFSKNKDYKILSCGHAIDTELFNMEDFGACPICEYQVDTKDLEEPKKRKPLSEYTAFKVIDLGSEKDVYNIFYKLLSSNTPLGEQDYNDITIILTKGDEDLLKSYIPEEIKIKETLAFFIITLIKDLNEDIAQEIISKTKFTATDILRISVSLSGGDISLADNSRFKSFSNKERRIIMYLLDTVKKPLEDMYKYKEQWKRLGEKIHPGTYKKFTNAKNYFEVIRNNPETIVRFDSMLEEFIKNKKVSEAADLLCERPGVFARRLDNLLRLDKSKIEYVLNAFEIVIDKITTTTLLQIKFHFKNRNKKVEFRYFLPKGSISKIFIKEDIVSYKIIDKEITNKVKKIINKELLKRFKKQSLIKKDSNVYINPLLKKCIVPNGTRNSSKSLQKITRGSVLPITTDKNIEANFLRFFTYWKGDIDLDLSITLHNENFETVSICSYTALRDNNFGLIHSGDIRSAPRGASEYVDINIKQAIKSGARYVVMSVISYSGEEFSLFEAFSGVMIRKNQNKGEPYEPKTVFNKIDLSGDSKYIIPMIFDLHTKEVIYADMNLKVNSMSNVESENAKIQNILRSILDFKNTKPNLFNLFKLHAKANKANIDQIFDKEKEYDIIFDIDNGVTPFNIEEISSTYLN